MAEQLDSQAAVVSPVNVQEFSKKVKEKYPEYKDIDDLTLAKKIVEKYPEYKDKVQFDPEPEATGTPPPVQATSQPEQPLTYMQKELRQKLPENYTEEQNLVQQPVKPLGKVDQLKVDYLRKTRGDEFANQEQAKMQVPETSEETGFAGKLGKTVGNSFMAGTNSLNSWVADAPGFIYDLAGAPFRAVGLNVPTSQDFKDTPLQNISSYYKDNAKAYENKVQQSNPSRGNGVIASFQNGDIEGGILNLAGGIAESAPASIAMMLSGGMTAPTILGGAAVFGAAKAQEMDENAPEMDYDKRRIISALNGTIEGIFETYLGSGAVGKSLAGIIKNQGKEVAQEQAKRSLSTVFADMITKNPWLAPLGEGFEEVGTQLAQNLVDKYSGYRPDIAITEGVGDSFLSGVGMGGIHGAVIGLAKKAMAERNAQPITTATIEGVQFTVNNPEDLGIEGKPVFVKDAEGNIIPVSGRKKDLITDVVTQTQGELDQAQQQAADQQALFNGIADPNAQILKDETFDEGARVVDFNNGQSKIIYNGQEVIANDENEKDEILNSITDYQKLPEAKTTPTVSTEPAVNTEPTDGLYSEPKTFNSQIPKKKVGNKEVTDYESAPAQTTLGALIEDFTDQSVVNELVNTKISDFESQINKIGKVKVIADIDQYKQNLKEAKEKTDAITKQLEYWKSVKMEAEVQAQNKARVDQEQKQSETEVLLDFIDEFNATPTSREDKQQASAIELEAKRLGYMTDRNASNQIFIYDQQNGRIEKPKVSKNVNNSETKTENVSEKQNQNEVDQFDTLFGNEDSQQINQLQNEELKKVTPIVDGQSAMLQGENTPQAQQGERVQEGLEENVNPINQDISSAVPPVVTISQTPEGTTDQLPEVGKMIEQAAAEVNINPTDKQKEAGNYKKGHVTVQGMNITIENPKGSVRKGVDEDGKAWENIIQSHYGYFKRTNGKDGDQIDTFIGDNPESEMIFVVDQINPKTGAFDESKVMTGFNSIEEAKAAYLANYETGWKGLSAITPVQVDKFKIWLNDGAKQTKPYSEYKEIKAKSKRTKQLSKVQKEAASIEVPPTDIRGRVLQYFANGGILNSSALETLYGNKTAKNPKVLAERRSRWTWVKNDEGMGIDELAHSLWEDSSDIEMNGLTTQDFRAAIESVINEYTSPVQMAKDLVKAYDPNKPQYSPEQLEEMELLGMFDEPLDNNDVEFERQGSDIAEVYLSQLGEYYNLTPEEQIELNNLFINNGTSETNTGTEKADDISSKESGSQEGVEGTKQEEVNPVIPESEVNPPLMDVLEAGKKAREEKKPIITVIPNGNTAFDKQAQGFLNAFLAKAKIKDKVKFAKGQLNYDLFAVMDDNQEVIGLFDSPESAYQGALNADIESFHIVRELRDGQNISYDYYTGNLFGDYDGEMYDEKGYLRNEVKQAVIDEIKKNFNIQEVEKQSTPLPEEKPTDKKPLDEVLKEGKDQVMFRIASKQTDTPEFKEWFGKSVFTENGKVGGTPMVLYHGTDRNFDSFRNDRMIYLTPSAEYANMYTAGQSAKGAHYVGKSEQELAKQTYSGESVMPVFARAEKPFDTRNPKHKAIFQKEYFGKYGNGAPLDPERGLPDWTDAEDLQEFFDEKGYDFDGLVLAESHGNITYAVFSPNQVKSATGNSGEFGKETNDVRFRISTDAEENNLVAVHNIKPEGLLNADRLGGLPMPSIAIIDVNNGFNSYGEITLIADKDFVDPKKNKSAKVFASDVYSARYPSISHELPKQGNNKLIKKVNDVVPEEMVGAVMNGIKNAIDDGGLSKLNYSDSAKVLFLSDTQKPLEIKYSESKIPESIQKIFIDNGWKNLEYFEVVDNDNIKKQLTDLYFEKDGADKEVRRFLSEDGFLNGNLMRNFINDVKESIRSKGKVDTYATRRAADNYVRENNLQDEFESYIRKLYNELGVEEKIYRGYSNSGNRLYSPHTLSNVLKEMKKSGIRGGENFGYGAGNIRAKVTPEFKNISQIKENRDRITQFDDDIKDSANQELIDVMDAIKPFYKFDSGSFGYYDNNSDELVPLARSGRSESFMQLDEESRKMVADFLNKLANMPTEYFEAKINRGVSLAEFKNALIPEDTSQEIRDILRFNGINAVEYKDNADRAEKLKEVTKEKNVRFRIIGETGAANIEGLIDNLTVAKQMTEAGKDKKTIFLATGWEKFKDGWKYDIPDIELNTTFDQIVDNYRNDKKEYLLSELVDDAELLKSYPKLKDTKIFIYEKGGFNNTGGFANHTDNVIGIAFSSTERENAQLGGRGKNRPITAYNSASFKSVLSHEIQHLIQFIEGFGIGGNPRTVYASIIEDRLRRLQEEKGMENVTERDKEEIESGIRKKYRTSRNAYDNLAGEVEARNVQDRIKLTPEQRKEKMISETQDVAESQKIYIQEAINEAYSMGEETFNVSSTASTDLSNRPNVVKALTKISDELGEPVHIINSSEIPAQVGELKKQITSGNRVPAFFYNGQIYLLSDQVTSVSDAIKSYLHELIVHKGLREVFAGAEPVSIIGKQYAKFNDLMIDVFGSMSRSQKIDIASKYVPGLYNQNGKIMYTPTAAEKALIGEEFLAHISENQEIYDEPTLTKWQQFINRLAQIIRKAFRLTSNQFSQSDLLDIVRESRARLKSKAEGKTEDETRFRVTEENLSLGEKPNDMTNPEYWKDKTVTYLHSPEPSPYMGSRFGQDVEPAGKYITIGHQLVPQGYTEGSVTFKNPLVIDVTGQNYPQWKVELSKKYNATGKKLTNKLLKEGYDSIITVEEYKGKYDASESIILNPEIDSEKGKREKAHPSNTILINGTPRPTLNSNGKPIAATEEGIRNFYKWFGDSKVVDENGRPLVVYHGTGNDFDAFSKEMMGENFAQSELGLYFTNSPKPDTSKGFYYGSSASEYAENSNGENKSILPVYLKIENPYNISADGWYSPNAAVDIQRSDIKRWMKDGNYDGIISENKIKEDYGNDMIFVVLDPSQIKSATGNNGSFDPQSNDIRFQIVKDEALNQLKEDLDKITTLQKSTARLNELEDSKAGKTKVEKQTIVNQISKYKEGYRAGASEKRLTLYVIQRNIIKYASDNMNYDQATRGEINQLLTAIKNANTPATISKAFDRIDEIVTKMNTNQERNGLKNDIETLIRQATSPKRSGTMTMGKFNIEDVRQFAVMKKYNDEAIRLSTILRSNVASVSDKNEARKELDRIWDELNEIPDKTIIDEVTLKIIDWRRSGSRVSVQLLTAIKDDLELLYKQAKDAKTEEDIKIAIVRKNDREFIGKFIREKKYDKSSIAKRFNISLNNFTANVMGNWETVMTMLGGVKLREKTSLIMPQVHQEMGVHNTFNEVLKKAYKAYGFKSKQELLLHIQDLSKKDFELIQPNFRGGKVEGAPDKISMMQIMDIYNAIKNRNIQTDWYLSYGDVVLDSSGKVDLDIQKSTGRARIEKLISNLSEGDKKFADIMMDKLQEYSPQTNEVFVKLFNMDRKSIEVYWPSSALLETDVDVMEQFFEEGKIPSFFKDRAAHRTPVPKDAFGKFTQHVKESEWIVNMALPLNELNKTFRNSSIKKLIEQNRGNKYYGTIKQHLQKVGLRPTTKELTDFERWGGNLLSNWVVAKIGLSVSVPLKQLIGAVNYAENMPAEQWLLGFAKSLADPKGTFDEVWENCPYLQVRFNNGYSEALQYVMNATSNLPKASNWHQAIKNIGTIGTRGGDIATLIYGGKPYIDYLIKNGMDKKDAYDKFIIETLRAQQSGLTSTLSIYQNSNNPFARALFTFSNTPSQYMRKMFEANQAFRHGDINAKQLTKVYSIYAVANSILYVGAGMLISAMLTGDEPEDEWEKMAIQGVLSFVGGLPLINDLAESTTRQALGLKVYDDALPVLVELNDIRSKLIKTMQSGDGLDQQVESDKNKVYLKDAIISIFELGGISAGNAVRMYDATINRDNKAKERKAKDAREIISKADKYHKFLTESIKRGDNELHDKLMSDKTALNAVSMLVISDQESGRKSYDSRITNLKKAIKYYKNIKTPEAQKKVDEYELLLENTYNEILEKYSDVEFPDSYKLNK